MTMTTVSIEQVRDIVVDVVPELEGQIRPTDRLGTDLGVDSMSLVDIVMKVEKHFGISIEDNEFESLQTTQDIFDLVQRRR